ncbi:MAG: radical SAM protein [Candidatus Omnitrophica bacterium]|nr:radical SAM protein [Candidatus Omnitrophota bacterium]
MYPSYLDSYNSGQLRKVSETVFNLLRSCALCPRKCGVNRLNNERGFCRAGVKARVCSYMPHHGEEPPISGTRGSGTIFFSGCNMACVYCQNYEFSQKDEGREFETRELSEAMLNLQSQGCHNINLVTPTHFMPQILKSLELAVPKGLNIPLVYNTSGYESADILRFLDGIVDIYLPDMRYAGNNISAKYSGAPGYPEFNRAALKEMHRQAGLAQLDENGLIKRGLIIRHLVLPNNVSGTEKIMKFVAQSLSKDTYISLMSQYTPYHKANSYKDICRRVNFEEYEYAKMIMERCGLSNGWTQDDRGLERFAGVNIKPLR